MLYILVQILSITWFKNNTNLPMKVFGLVLRSLVELKFIGNHPSRSNRPTIETYYLESPYTEYRSTELKYPAVKLSERYSVECYQVWLFGMLLFFITRYPIPGVSLLYTRGKLNLDHSFLTVIHRMLFIQLAMIGVGEFTTIDRQRSTVLPDTNQP